MFSKRPLSYCTNVHPGQTVAEVLHGLTTCTIPMREHVQQPVAAGLWLPCAVIDELNKNTAALEQFANALTEHNLPCYTLNAFPYGNFHDHRVKEQVYVPDWSAPGRLQYTWDCAQVLARILPDESEGSISTVPLGFKGLVSATDFESQAVANLITLSERLSELFDKTGKFIRLAIEPEPLCLLETTQETLQFFDRLYLTAEALKQSATVRQHIGVCYDVCHQAVEFENIAASIAELTAAEIRINKLHITCALQLDNPAENMIARKALAEFAEPRYLHQTFAKSADGTVRHITDLSAEFALKPPEEFLQAEQWRIHFHVPVNAERVGPLQTTRPEMLQALQAVGRLDYAPHLEVETYTWNVLPGEPEVSLVEGLSREMSSTLEFLSHAQNGMITR